MKTQQTIQLYRLALLAGRPLLLAQVLCLPLVVWQPLANADEIQDDRLRFVEIMNEDCDKLDGKLIALQNMDPEKSLEVWLERWVSGVASSLQRKYTLLPNKEPMPLGCSVIAEGDQHWKVTGVEFIK